MALLRKGRFVYGLAGTLLVLAWLSLWLVRKPPPLRVLWYAGWVIWALGVVLIFLPIYTLSSRGRPEEGKGLTHTMVMVDRGVYALVRHPLYLGWSLMYAAVVLFGQNWLTTIVAIPGMPCVYVIAREEDRRLVERFGDAYSRYMQSVPAMNLLAGTVRWVRRRRS